MKILHLLSSNSYSGAENVACTIIKKLGKKYECVYCSPNGPIKDTLKEKQIEYIPIKKMSYKRIEKVIINYDPDIIHAHDYRAACLAALFSENYRIIAHIHGNREEMHQINIKTLLFRLLSKRFHRIIWVSDSCLNDYVYKEKVRKNSLVLYNIVNKKEIIKKSKEYKCDKEYDLIFLGRLNDIKNPIRFIEIIKDIKNIKVAIVGDGELKEEIIELIKTYKLTKRVKVYGFINNPYPILDNSKILVMTSVAEGTPMVALEAQALGKPIVSTPIDGLKKIIKDGYNGYLCNTNEGFIKAINLLLDDNHYNKMKENINNNFTEINNEDKYIKVIKDCYK